MATGDDAAGPTRTSRRAPTVVPWRPSSAGIPCPPRVRSWLAAAIIALALSGCAPAPARPSAEEWSVTWTRAQGLVPSESSLAPRPDDRTCDRVLVSLRKVRASLTPAPDEVVDDAVRDWLGQAEHMFFECFSAVGSDPPEDAYRRLDQLRRQVTAALQSASPQAGVGTGGDDGARRIHW